ncbi:MAG: hypothetical protein J7M39_00845 [Anaerolineae bacterium]|nr:hypothetical protein [Anaerolineae bacterium]
MADSELRHLSVDRSLIAIYRMSRNVAKAGHRVPVSLMCKIGVGSGDLRLFPQGLGVETGVQRWRNP